MTDKEIRDYINLAVQNALIGVTEVQKPNPRVFEETHNKWFVDENGNASLSKIGRAFDMQGYRAYAIWDRVRPVATWICGKRYARDIPAEDAEMANRIAEKLCQTVYELKLEFDEYKGEKEKQGEHTST